MGEGRSKRGLPKMADPHLFWNKRWQGMFQLLIQNTCKYIFLFLLLVLSMFMFVCHTYIHTYIHTSNDTPTVYTRVLSLVCSLSLTRSNTHRQLNTQTHMLTLSLASLFIYCQGKRRRSEVGRTEIQRRESEQLLSSWLCLAACLRGRRKPTSDASLTQEQRIVWTFAFSVCVFLSA